MSGSLDPSQLLHTETDDDKATAGNTICIICGSDLIKSNDSEETTILKDILAQTAFVDWFEFVSNNDCHFGFCENCQKKAKKLREISEHLMKLREAIVVWSNAIVVSMRKVIMSRMTEKIADHAVLTDEKHFRSEF